MLSCQVVDQLLEPLELGGPAGWLLVDEERTVGRHAAHEEPHAQPKDVHLGEVGFSHDLAHGAHMRVVQLFLFVARRDADDLHGAGRELEPNRVARAPKKDGGESSAEIVEVFVAGELPALVEAVVAMVETKVRTEALRIDEADDRVEIVEPVLERRAREDNAKREASPLTTRLVFASQFLMRCPRPG